MIKIIEDTFDPRVWNEAARHPLQSWEWGDARVKTGVKILRIGEYRGSKLLNVLLIMFHPIPYTQFKVGYIPRSDMPSKDIVLFLQEYGRTNSVSHFQFEFNLRDSGSPDIPPQFRQSRNPLFPRYTQTLDLRPAEKELLGNMKSKTRYNIRLAQRKGVTVQEMTDDKGFEIFAELYFATTGRQKYHGHNKEYHKIVFDTLKKSIAHILIAFYQGKPLAAYELFLFGKTLYYPYGGSSNGNKEVMAPNLLMWEAIRFGKRHKAETFDMWGSLAPDYKAGDPWAGFTRFKEGYGSVFTKMAGSHDLVINPLIYGIFSAAYYVRNKII